jgi:2-oxoisovalerate dehydrogenase E1 component
MRQIHHLPETVRYQLDLYRYMVMARTIDDLEKEYIHRGEAFFHVSGAGHEGTVALYPHLIAQDWLHCHYRDKALMLARGISPEMFFRSFFCKEASHSYGRQMSAHMSDPSLNILSIVGPVGNSALQAVGVASVIRDQAGSPIVLCALGDGMSQQGEVLEAIAHAVRDQLPVLFLIHNNHYAISTLTQGKTFFSHPDGNPETFYGTKITWINGRDVISAYHEFGKIVASMRTTRQPALVIIDVERLSNHTNADDQQVYRSQKDIEQAWATGDPIRILRTHLERHEVTCEVLDQIEEEVQTMVTEAAQHAQTGSDPRPIFTTKKEIPSHLQNPKKEYRGDQSEPRLTMRESLQAVLEYRMHQDDRITLFGEDIEDPKGDVFGVTCGLTQKFQGRVANSPLSESTIIGFSVGRALAGARPVAFIQFADFLPLAYNQIFAELGSIYWRSNGGWEAPVIVMVSCGAYRPGLGPFHSSSLESLAVHTPGIDVFMPSTAADAAGLLNAAFESERPTLFFYPKSRLNDSENTTSADVARQFVPIGKARVIRHGKDITLVGWGNTVSLCQKVASTLEDEGFFAEVIDLRSLSPWDETTILASAEKTGRLIVVHEDNHSCGLGAEIVATVMENAQKPVKVKRVTRPDTYIPCNFENQLEVLPSYKRVLDTAAELLHLEITWIIPEKQRETNLCFVEVIGSSPSDESVTIIEFHVTPGSMVSPGDRLATVEAAKAILELSAPVGGQIVELLVHEGDTVKVGAPIITVKTDTTVSCKMLTQEQPGIPVFRRKEGKPHGHPVVQPPDAHHKVELPLPPTVPQIPYNQDRQLAVGISAISTSLGSRIVTNEHIVKMIPTLTTKEIVRLTGIESRHWVNEHETALTLGISAARSVLDKTNLDIGAINLLLCCSGTPVFMTPSMACLILNALSQHKSESHIQAYDVNAACSGYLYALQVAYDYLQSCPQDKVLIVTTETLSCKVNPTDSTTAPIFGDGASATLLYGEAHIEHVRALLHRPVVSAKGEDGQALCVPINNSHEVFVTMDGHKVFSEAVRTMIMMLKRACTAANIRTEDLSLIVPHQANTRIIEAIRKQIKFPKEKVFSNIRHIGNTSSSSIPLCLEGLLQERNSGEYLGLCAFGGGFTFGGAILRIR